MLLLLYTQDLSDMHNRSTLQSSSDSLPECLDVQLGECGSRKRPTAHRAFHAATDDCVTGRAPHSPEGHYPAPCVVVVLDGGQLLHVLPGVPNP